MSSTSTKLLAVLALVITFVAGAVIGVLADHVMILHGGGHPPHMTADFVARRLDKRLHFSDDQRRQVVTIIDRHQRRIGEIWGGVRPAVHREIEAANIEIDRVLTAPQRIEFAKIRMRLMPRRGGDGIRFRHD